jgi:hypothetical protein
MDFDNPRNAKAVEFVADEKLHECSIDFQVEGHLAKLTFDFGQAQGTVDFDWIML